MIAIVVLAMFVVWSAYRLRRAESPERQKCWQQALAIGEILFVVHAARGILAGIPSDDCDIRIAGPKADSALIR